MKRELSSQTLNTISNIAKKNHDFQEKLSSNSGYNFSYYTTSHHSNVISRLTSHLPKWGGLCVLTENHDNFGYNRLKIVNTCSIDYFLLTFWVSKILDQNIINILEEHRNSQNQLITIINEIIYLIGSRQWNRAKSLWIIDVCRLRPDAKNEFDCYGNEYRLFVHYVRCLQEFKYYCSNKKCFQFNVSIEWATEIFFKRHQDNSVRYLTLKCHHCSEILLIRFTFTPPWLLIETEYNESKGLICFEYLPKIVCIDNQNLQLLCATVGSMNSFAHFKSYFTLDNRCFMINDIGPTIVEVVT